jgi:hypothetical protein
MMISMSGQARQGAGPAGIKEIGPGDPGREKGGSKPIIGQTASSGKIVKIGEIELAIRCENRIMPGTEK